MIFLFLVASACVPGLEAFSPPPSLFLRGGTAHLLDEEPGVAGSAQDGGLLEAVLEDGLQGGTQRPPGHVGDRLRDRVVPRQAVLGRPSSH